jgi:hypothetical protein
MQPLEKSLRNKLERTVKDAREISEDAARAALEQLGVSESTPYPHLSDQEKNLRRKLRAHGRQLGDVRQSDGEQEIIRLAEKVAYEHWHRMLFARFLAENNLLMYPDPDNPIAVSLEECEDLAEDEGARNGWELAARFAARMLPQIFRPDSPVFQLILSPEHEQKMKRLLDDLPKDIFTASDSLGWVYQFWQAKKKDEINASEVKIGARELPVVTQLFTEPYMVAFLLDNSLGAWWAAHRLSEDDLKNAQNEEELRSKASLPGVPLEYLRFVRGEDSRWTPAAGTFDGWPEQLSELRVLDPCCGSGHFLVAAFLMLVAMRMELERLSAQEAVNFVLRDNLHGLEIDPRCVELAAFALALAAWRYPGAGGYRKLPDLALACTGLSISAKKEDWLALAGGDENLQYILDELYRQFKDAPMLGSLINPKATFFQGNLTGMEWDNVAPLLTKALSGEKDDEKWEMGVVAQGLARAAPMLAGKYHWVITNVPYLARGRQVDELRTFGEAYYAEAKQDLATIFLSRCLQFCKDQGVAINVLPQNWLFLTSYRKFREYLLRNDTWHIISRLGPKAFQTPMWDFNVQLIIISRGQSSRFAVKDQAEPSMAHMISGLDISTTREVDKKAALLRKVAIKQVVQESQLNNPDARVTLEDAEDLLMLMNYASGFKGITTNDDPLFVQFFWEQSPWYDGWEPFQSTITETSFWGGCEKIVLFEQGRGRMRELAAAQDRDRRMDMRGKNIWRRYGVAISCMGALPASLYKGHKFDTNVSMIIPNNPAHLSAIWCFCSSSEYCEEIRQIDQALKVTNATLVKVPFDIERWQKVAAEKYPYGLPKPCSDDPTQWIFHGHPAKSDDPLQVAVARLLGYRWPAELDPEMELSDEARAWAKKCDSLLSYSDKDGIVCIPPVRGEASAVDQLLNLLAAAYGNAWSNDKLSELLKEADHAGKTLETWLREKFFVQHCKLFHNSPFIWHIWDGQRDGFAALVNYHKLDRKNLETLIYTYIGDWINRQKDDIRQSVDGAEERLIAAENLKQRLELILEGEEPYDIFVRWKPIEEQPIGWDPDLNDGVRMNIRPFMSVPDVRKKGAGVFRDKPNIKWNKDRGKDVESAPWYHLGPHYDGKEGDRINDHHLSLTEKRAARQAKERKLI